MGDDLYSELRSMRPDVPKGRKRGRRAEDRDPAASSRPPADVPERRRSRLFTADAAPDGAIDGPSEETPTASGLSLGTKGVVPTTRDRDIHIPSTLSGTGRSPQAGSVRTAPEPTLRSLPSGMESAPRLEATLTNLSKSRIPDVDFPFTDIEAEYPRAEAAPPPVDPASLSRKERRARRQAEKDAAKEELKQQKADKKAEKTAAKQEKREAKRPTPDPDFEFEDASKREMRGELRKRRRERKRQLDSHEAVVASKVRAMRIGVLLWWIGLGGAAAYGLETGRIEDPTFSIPLAAGALLAAVLLVIPWKRITGRITWSLLALVSVLGLIALVTVLEPHIDSDLVVFSLYVSILAYSAVLLPVWGYAIGAVATVGIYGTLIWLADPRIEPATVIPVASLAGIAAVVALMNTELLRYARQAAKRLVKLEMRQEELSNRQRDLEAIYEVSRTIGAGEAMDKVIPELIERTAGYVNAKVGVMLIHRPAEEILDALSPIWAAGQPLEADAYHLPLNSNSGAVWAFRNGQPIALNQIADPSGDPLVADLGVERIAAVPLQVENKAIGVLMVADKPTEFTDEDLATLELLATPAALVMQSLVRLEASQETGRKMSELARMKSDFVSVVSHELRTPLTSVIGALSTMSRPELAPTNPTALNLLDSARGQAQRLRVLIEDLLTVSKIDNQALPQRTELIEVESFLAEMLSTDENWEAVSTDIADGLDPIVVDRDHLRRIITNLVDNARKYASDSLVEIVAANSGDNVRISVVDHGPGVPFQYRETIFERFTQVEAAGTRGTGGTGLGLSIVRELAESMGGKAWYEPTVGGGATFVTEFPAAEEAEAVA